jgi:hypothetical protein
MSPDDLEAVDLTDMEFEPLMFQSGYLTVDRTEADEYLLIIPNREVDHAFNAKLARYFSGKGQLAIKGLAAKTRRGLASFDAAAMEKCLSMIVSWLTYHEKTAGEGVYHAAIISSLKTMLFKVDSEVTTAKGRYGFDIKLGSDTIYVCEIKIEKLEKT